jgi:hypothetical protein
MAVLQTPHAHEMQPSPTASKRSRWRLALLSMLLSLSIAFNIYFLFTAPPADTSDGLFITLWLVSFLPYLAACILVLATKPQVGRGKWIELGLILVGALTLRAILLPVLPDLSHDSWRYLWDARVTLHGYSPYVYGPGNPLFISLRDFVYNNSRFRSAPTIYPPGAQAIYLLSYLLAPSNLIVLKGFFVGFDVITCGALAFLLQRKGLDMSRCIIYAWCPLPIIEFAIQGHLDAATITFTVLAILCAGASWRGSRVVTGFLIAMATLTKIYPILLLVVIVRRRDWALLTTCFATIIIGYVPYLILGHGQILGFFGTYASEQTPNAGLTQFVVVWIENQFLLNKAIGSLVIYILDAILVGTVSLIILRLRWQERISMEAATFIVIGTIFAASSHIFPWYNAAFLPWIATQIAPLGVQWKRISKPRINWRDLKNLRPRWSSLRHTHLHWNGLSTFNAGSLATLSLWYFTCSAITAYTISWNTYYQRIYGITLLGLGIAIVIGIMKKNYTLRNERQDPSKAFHVKWVVGKIFSFVPGKRGT